MTWPLISQDQLIEHVGARAIERATDDDGDGITDSEAMTRVLVDASSRVMGALRAPFDRDTLEPVAEANMPSEVVRLTLEAAQVILVKRHPGVRPDLDWVELNRALNDELRLLRSGATAVKTTGELSPQASPFAVASAPRRV